MARHVCRNCGEDWYCGDIEEWLNNFANEAEDEDLQEAVDRNGCKFHRRGGDPWGRDDAAGTGRRIYSCPSCDADAWSTNVVMWYMGNYNPGGAEAPPPPPPDPNRCYCNRCA
jgi:hypothetical protein